MSRRASFLVGLLLIAMVLSLSGCQAPTPTPEPTPTQEVSHELVMTYHLDGGIAELCYELAIQADGEYHLSSCKHADVYGTLGGQFLAQLQEWNDLYAPFEEEDKEDPADPQSTTRRLVWDGRGREPTSQDTRRKMLSWAAELPIEELRRAQADTTALHSARAYLAKLLSVDEETIVLGSYETANWPDASLGCPQEGQAYAQVATAGYSIVFSVANRDYEVHTNADGSGAILCVKPPAEEAFTTYTSTQSLYSIAHPKDWAATVGENQDEVTIAPKEAGGDLGIAITYLGEGHSVADASTLLGEYKDTAFSQEPSAVIVTEPEGTETSAARGQKMSYQVTMKGGHVRQYTAAVLISDAGLAFRVLLWAPQEEYWDHAGEFSKVLHSFQPLPGASPTAKPSLTGTPTTAVSQATPAPKGMFVGKFEGYVKAPNIPSDRASVRGKVVDANGNPMVGQTLQLSAFDWHIDAHTGGDGTYAFDWLNNELTFTVTPLSFPGNPVDVMTDFGRAGIVNYRQQP